MLDHTVHPHDDIWVPTSLDAATIQMTKTVNFRSLKEVNHGLYLDRVINHKKVCEISLNRKKEAYVSQLVLMEMG